MENVVPTRSMFERIKHSHIVDSLNKGIGKKKETFVLSSFCLDPRLRELKPFFQYPVKKPNSDAHYFYDLYYQSINVMIEVDEEHHENSKEEDKTKEEYAVKQLGVVFFRIKFHESHAALIDQVEAVKNQILRIIAQHDFENIKWNVSLFDPENAIKSHRRTVIISVSRKRKVEDLTMMSLQIPLEIQRVRDVNLIYLTGDTGTVAGAYIVQPEHWIRIDQGNVRHDGTQIFDHPMLLSGDTFYRKSQNILFSDDLLALKSRP
jgi:very-short-patch-repair endonuclease